MHAVYVGLKVRKHVWIVKVHMMNVRMGYMYAVLYVRTYSSGKICELLPFNEQK